MLHKSLTALLLLGLLSLELLCFFYAWSGEKHNVVDFLMLALLHWPLVPLQWLVLARLRKHRAAALSVPILLLAICEGVMFMFLVMAMLNSHDMIRGMQGGTAQDVLGARLWLAFAMLAQVFKFWPLLRASAWVAVWPKAYDESLT